MIDRTNPILRSVLVQTTGPSAEPLTTAEIKSHLRVDHSSEDALIAAIGVAARQSVEHYTSRRLITSTHLAIYDAWPRGRRAFELPVAPVQSIDSITYRDADGADQTLDPSVYKTSVSTSAGIEPAEIWLADGQTWPDTDGEGHDIQIEFTAGYGDDGSDVPAALRQSILLYAGTLYENRESVIVGAPATTIPHTVDFLIGPYKLHQVN